MNYYTITILETMKPTELAQLYILAMRYPDLITATIGEIQTVLEASIGLVDVIQEIKSARLVHDLK